MSRYAPHERLVASARPNSGFGRLAFGLVVIWLGFVMASGPLILRVSDIVGMSPDDFMRGDRPGPLLFKLALLGVLGGMVLLVSRALHSRQFGQIAGPIRPGLRELRQSFLAVILITLLIAFLLPGGSATETGLHMTNFGAWLLMLPISLGVILLQAGSEELLFRGYLQQHLAARFPEPAVWMGVTNMLFAFAHIGNVEAMSDGWKYLLIIFAIGMAASDLVARSGSLYPAIGLHSGNNAWALLMFRADGGEDSGLALYRIGTPGTIPEAEQITTAMMLIELGALFCVWLAIRIALRR